MKVKKFNELYEQQPKQGWGSDTDKTNYYTFTCDITVRANSQEEAEDKMEFIANQNEDVELGVYNLSYVTEGGKSRMVGMKEPEALQEKAEVNTHSGKKAPVKKGESKPYPTRFKTKEELEKYPGPKKHGFDISQVEKIKK